MKVTIGTSGVQRRCTPTEITTNAVHMFYTCMVVPTAQTHTYQRFDVIEWNVHGSNYIYDDFFFFFYKSSVCEYICVVQLPPVTNTELNDKQFEIMVGRV